MRYRIANSKTEVEVTQFRPMDKGALKGFFTLIEYNEDYPKGRKTLDCRYFNQGENRWMSFPHKEVTYKGTEKPEFIPLVSYPDKEYFERLKVAALEAIEKEHTNGSKGNVPDDPSFNW